MCVSDTCVWVTHVCEWHMCVSDICVWATHVCKWHIFDVKHVFRIYLQILQLWSSIYFSLRVRVCFSFPLLFSFFQLDALVRALLKRDLHKSRFIHERDQHLSHPPFCFDGYCSTVQGLLDWFEVDLGFTELSFIHERDQHLSHPPLFFPVGTWCPGEGSLEKRPT